MYNVFIFDKVNNPRLMNLEECVLECKVFIVSWGDSKL